MVMCFISSDAASPEIPVGSSDALDYNAGDDGLRRGGAAPAERIRDSPAHNFAETPLPWPFKYLLIFLFNVWAASASFYFWEVHCILFIFPILASPFFTLSLIFEEKFTEFIPFFWPLIFGLLSLLAQIPTVLEQGSVKTFLKQSLWSQLVVALPIVLVIGSVANMIHCWYSRKITKKLLEEAERRDAEREARDAAREARDAEREARDDERRKAERRDAERREAREAERDKMLQAATEALNNYVKLVSPGRPRVDGS